jgi:hypothetical protein
MEMIEDDARRYVSEYRREILHLASILFTDGCIDAAELRAAMRDTRVARLDREPTPPAPAPQRVDPPPPAHHAAPSTSHDAARAIAPHAPRMRDRVMAYLRTCGGWGATDEEAGEALALRPQSYTPRRGELVKLGFVVDSGERRATASGRWAVVWVHIDFAERREVAR